MPAGLILGYASLALSFLGSVVGTLLLARAAFALRFRAQQADRDFKAAELSQIGRWVSKDPLRFDSEDAPNLYVYVNGDPVTSWT